MSSNPEPKSLWWPFLSVLLLLSSQGLFSQARHAAQVGGIIISQSTHRGPMTPAQGYGASAVMAILGLLLLGRWIQLVRRSDDDETSQKRHIRIGNLIFASLALLTATVGAWQSHLQHPRLITVRELGIYGVAFFWVGGAIGLFFRKRLGWVVSLIALAVTACFFSLNLMKLLWRILYPSAAMHPDLSDGGYQINLAFRIAVFSILLVLSLRVFNGLLKMGEDYNGCNNSALER